MPVRKYRPTSPGRRFQSVSTFEEVTKRTPEKSLLTPLRKTGGRNALGRVTCRHHGGGHKRMYRLIDFRREKLGVPAKVVAVEYDPNRSSRIALLHYVDGEKRYILAPLGLAVGDQVMSGPDAEVRVARITEPATLDGGDVLQVGRTVYVGRGGRTNGEGVRQLRALLAPLGRTVVAVGLGEVLHLKSAVTALPDGSLLGLPGVLDLARLPGVRVPPEAAGAHVVPLGGSTALIAASAPRTALWLGDLGFDLEVVDIGEFEKLEGCVTCLSVLIPT